MKLQVGPTIPISANKTVKYLKLYQCPKCKDASLIEHTKSDDVFISAYAYICCTKCRNCGKLYGEGGHYIASPMSNIYYSLDWHAYEPERRHDKREARNAAEAAT